MWYVRHRTGHEEVGMILTRQEKRELARIAWCKAHRLLPSHWVYPLELKAERIVARRIARVWARRAHCCRFGQ